MEPTRRTLLAGGAAVLAGTFLPAVTLPNAFASNEAADNAFARLALNRLTFGATKASMVTFQKLGFEAWLDQQLAMRGDSEEVKKRLAEAVLPISYEDGKDENGHSWKGKDEPKRKLNFLNSPATDLVPLNDWELGMGYSERERPAREIQLATLIRARHQDAQLFELMVQFWHEHFSVNSVKDAGCSAYFPLHDKAIRAGALGNFRTLLGATAKSPSMLFYLNNEGSKASPANENYARELLELHTLGEINYPNDQFKDWKDVPGAKDGLAVGYIDQDVYETARAFTGWSVADGRDIAEGEKLPRTGEFTYIQGWHDPYQKRILGREFRANASPMEDGETVMDMLAKHPGTAQFIALKLCRRLVADEPPEKLVKEAAAQFLSLADDPDQIAKTIKFIALSPHFSEGGATKMKRPFEFLVSLYRATDAEIIGMGSALDTLARAGWRIHEWRPPTGHPDVASYWANTNTISVTTQIATIALDDWFGCAKADLTGGERAALKTNADLARYWAETLFVSKPDDAFVVALAEALGAPDDTLAEDDGGRQWQTRTLIALSALTPEFMLR
jgi:uncharacterized protein (DUF1800 family)